MAARSTVIRGLHFLPSSPRQRRRLARIGMSVALVGGLAGLLVAAPNRNAAPEQRFSNAPAQVDSTPQTVPLLPRDRMAITAVLDRFIPSAVTRRSLGLSSLASAGMREGMSAAEWSKGAIPVSPYPVRGHSSGGWTLNFSYRDDVSLDVLLQPAPVAAKRIGALSYTVELKKVRGAWRVDSMIPRAGFAAVGGPATVVGPRDFTPGGMMPSGKGQSRLSAMWLLVPAILLGLIPVVPFAILLADRRGLRLRRRSS